MTFPFPAVIAQKPATVALTDNVLDTSDASTYTFTNRAVGAAAPGRIVVVTLHTIDTADNSVSSATIGGITASILLNIRVNNGAAWVMTSIIYAVVPTGTTATIAVTLADVAFRCYAGVFAINGALSPTPIDSGSSTANPGAVANIDVPAGGVAIGASSIQDSGTTATFSWTNLTESFDADGENTNEQYSGACATFAGTQSNITITATPTAATQQTTAVASWR